MAAVEPTHASVSFELVVRGGAAPPKAGRLVLRPYRALGVPIDSATSPVAPESDAAISITLGGEAGMVARLPRDSRWEVQADIPGFWVRKELVIADASPNASPLRLTLWPLSHLAGGVKVTRGIKPPREIVVTTLAPRVATRQTDLPRGLMRCPVDAQGRFSCELPAATFDLSVSAEGFVPHYFWGVAIPVVKGIDLGALSFTRGSSVAGWIEVPGGGFQPEICTARLQPLGGANLAEAEKAGRQAQVVHPSSSGFFQLRGIAPGVYAFEVRQEGFSPSRLAPVRVENDVESFVGSVVLRRSLDLEVAIEPPLDWRGHPWRIAVMRALEYGRGLAAETVFEGAADAEGVAKFHAGAGGTFSFSVIDSAGQRFAEQRGVLLEDQLQARQVIQVRWVEVEGTLRHGKEPTAGTIWFGLEHGAVSIRMEADPQGAFSGALPEGRDWLVEIAASGLPTRLIRQVRVEPNGEGKSRLDIEIPDARLFGRILDDQGRPVEGADVALAPADGFPLRSSSTEQGGFEFRGVPAGTVQVSATLRQGEAFAEPVTLDLGEAQDVGPVELRLVRGQAFEGSVVSNRGPVPGATVTAIALLPPLGMVAEGRTRSTGEFRLALPASVQLVGLVVGPPGSSLRVFTLPVGGKPPPLQVTDDAGTLRVRVAADEPRPRLALFQDGIEIPLALARRWALGHGVRPDAEPMEFPAMSPGIYRVCSSPQAGSEGKGQAGRSPRCAEGVLAPGERLELTP